MIRAAGYGDVSLDSVRAALKERLAAMGAGVHVDPERAKGAEELFLKAVTDQELRQALQAAATPEAKRDVLAQAGYGDLTLDDLRAAAAHLAQREELSDEELELVSGGTVALEPGAVLGTAVGAGAFVGAAGGPVGAAVGALVGLGLSMLAVQAYAPPPSQW